VSSWILFSSLFFHFFDDDVCESRGWQQIICFSDVMTLGVSFRRLIVFREKFQTHIIDCHLDLLCFS
jgi:hypothetical protein